MIERFGLFSSSIFKISKIWHKVAAEEMAKFGLYAAHLIYLLALYQSENGLNASQLAEAGDKDKSDVSRSLQILMQKGFVRKEGTSVKSYGAVFHLTAIGEEVAKRICERITVVMEMANENVSVEKRRNFYEVLDCFVRNISKIAEQGIPDTLSAETVKNKKEV